MMSNSRGRMRSTTTAAAESSSNRRRSSRPWARFLRPPSRVTYPPTTPPCCTTASGRPPSPSCDGRDPVRRPCPCLTSRLPRHHPLAGGPRHSSCASTTSPSLGGGAHCLREAPRPLDPLLRSSIFWSAIYRFSLFCLFLSVWWWPWNPVDSWKLLDPVVILWFIRSYGSIDIQKTSSLPKMSSCSVICMPCWTSFINCKGELLILIWHQSRLISHPAAIGYWQLTWKFIENLLCSEAKSYSTAPSTLSRFSEISKFERSIFRPETFYLAKTSVHTAASLNFCF
ncbi:uncharacterized protein LOC119323236 isoform X2 [Triticum dicoccoides]|uniref:uncharacterized protein LOC119323236 isoform X2 n=1 Tax=Triticum dicoccoides TaxID=85692 RepID=UPI001891A898|nr:uncharacterized protein LOC119323236 isoform X2 [Triticum dicoccoides]